MMAKIKTKKILEYRIGFLAIMALTLIECIALFLGYNGQLQRWTMVAIAGLAGLTLPQLKIK